MLPVVDRPLIQHVVDEARQAGIEHLIFVTGRNKSVIEDHFDRQFELELTLTERGKKAELSLLSKDLPGGNHQLHAPAIATWPGHAVWCARELVGHEPFALLLPDVLVQHPRGCLTQMIDAAKDLDGNANIIAVEEVPAERAYVWCGRRRRRKGKGISITKMVESRRPAKRLPIFPSPDAISCSRRSELPESRRRAPAVKFNSSTRWRWHAPSRFMD